MDGVACRLLAASSLARGELSNVTVRPPPRGAQGGGTRPAPKEEDDSLARPLPPARFHSTDAQVEFTTPAAADPNGMLVCGLAAGFEAAPADFALASLREGGDLYGDEGGQEMVAATPAGWAAAPFLQGSATQWGHAPAEFGTVHHVFGTDPYYATSYHVRRYDDLVADGEGNSLAGLVAEPRAGPGGAGEHGNCVLLTAAWMSGRRYQVTFQARNPPPAVAGDDELRVWVAPVTYALHPSSKPGGGRYVTYRTRGSKAGHICRPRAALGPAQFRLFDACADAAGINLPGVTEASSAAECVAALGLVAAAKGLAHPPFVSHAAADRATKCPLGQVLAARFGECVRCGSGGVEVDAKGREVCGCAATQITRLVGEEGCADVYAQGVQSASVRDVAASLCASFSARLEQLRAGLVGDAEVAASYVRAFVDLASPFINEEFVRSKREEFVPYLFDERNYSPSRQKAGVGATCQYCDADGRFASHTGGTAKPEDLRHRAVETFRFIGFLLAEMNHDCPALFDPNEPLKAMYGEYKPALCS